MRVIFLEFPTLVCQCTFVSSVYWKQQPHFHLCMLNNLEKNLASQSISKSYSVSAATYLLYKKYYSSSIALLHFYSRFLSFYTRLKVNTFYSIHPPSTYSVSNLVVPLQLNWENNLKNIVKDSEAISSSFLAHYTPKEPPTILVC